jgi:catechol 2,3-dioxygenase-like lactoylglutathione lyase family enzyme
MTARAVLRVKDPTQAVRFYGQVLGFDVLVFDDARARVELPGLELILVREDRAATEAVFGAGAAKHRPGVGVEIRVTVADPPAYAARVAERGGFLVAKAPDATTVRDGDGYVITFEKG